MSKKINIKIDYFEGPFDLLLKLVNQQKLDIGKISITSIIDQYLQTVAHMQQVDLDMSSDFLLVASSLLKIKTDAILKLQLEEDEEESDNIDSSDVYKSLRQKLLIYKQYSDACNAMLDLAKEQSNFISRNAGPDPQYLDLAPDYLKGVSLDDLSHIAANCFARRDQFLLDSTHIASKPIPVASYVKTIYHRLQNTPKMNFSELLDPEATSEIIVVNFLAMLELYKRDYIEISQKYDLDDITISLVNTKKELDLTDKDLEEIQ